MDEQNDYCKKSVSQTKLTIRMEYLTQCNTNVCTWLYMIVKADALFATFIHESEEYLRDIYETGSMQYHLKWTL